MALAVALEKDIVAYRLMKTIAQPMVVLTREKQEIRMQEK